MIYDITKPTPPEMPTLGKGLETQKLLLSQTSKDMFQPEHPLLYAPLGSKISGAECINYRKNKNTKSAGYGKYYAEVDRQKTLTTRGLSEHIASHNFGMGREAIEAVSSRSREVFRLA